MTFTNDKPIYIQMSDRLCDEILYVPSGTELAFAFVDGKWELRTGAQGRLTNKKLNKDFAPLPKQAPSYDFNRNGDN